MKISYMGIKIPEQSERLDRTMEQVKYSPVIPLDFPDPDVIRVKDTYYMITTTMHYFPGGVILRSYDLIHWEYASYVFETLDETDSQKLKDGKNIYGKGMWAASLRFHNGIYFVCFVANDTGRTYLYQSRQIEGPWKKQYVEGFYHDCSLLFDEKRVFLAYGNTAIRLTELKADLTGPKPGGLNRIIIEEKDNLFLGYEGSHIYKIRDKYYVFLIHSLPDRWRRVQACFCSDSLEGPFTGGDILNDDMDYYNQGIAQGGVVDTPDGTWYGILFQDHGAVGRLPVIVPVTWKDDFPVFGTDGKVPSEISVPSSRPGYIYRPLTADDDFSYLPDREGKIRLNPAWQWNHQQVSTHWSVDPKQGGLILKTDRICSHIEQSVNTLTQRMLFPACAAEITIDAAGIKEGDYAGLCSFQGCYGFAAITKKKGSLFLVLVTKEAEDTSLPAGSWKIRECEKINIPWKESQASFRLSADFARMKDEACFYYREQGCWKQLGGPHKLYFKMDHFTGCRFGLFLFGTKETGGLAVFRNFRYLR